MENEDFLQQFYLDLRNELDNDKFVDSIEKLIEKNRFNKNNYMKLLKEEFYE